MKWIKAHSLDKIILCLILAASSTYIYARRPEFNQTLPSPLGGTILLSALLMWTAYIAFGYFFLRGALTFFTNLRRVSHGAPPVTQALLDGESPQQPLPQPAAGAPETPPAETTPQTQEGPQVIDNRPPAQGPPA